MTNKEIITHLDHVVHRADKNLMLLLSDNEREAIRKAKSYLTTNRTTIGEEAANEEV